MPNYIMINGYKIDASLKESHAYKSEASKYPLEASSTPNTPSNFTDHIRQLPISVTLDGVVTNAPNGKMLAVRQQAQNSESALQVNNTALNSFFGSSTGTPITYSPTAEALSQLEAIYNAQQPVDIQTSLRTYKSMAMEDLVINRDEKTGDALTFTARFEQVFIVTSTKTQVRVATRSAGPKKANTGGAAYSYTDTNLNNVNGGTGIGPQLTGGIDPKTGIATYQYSASNAPSSLQSATGSESITLSPAQVDASVQQSGAQDLGTVDPNTGLMSPHWNQWVQ